MRKKTSYFSKKAVIVFFSLILAMSLCACGNQAEKWQEQYNLGQQYLNDGNYEEAIIAYTAAIEIDEKQVDAFAGRGDAYNGLYTEITENNYTPQNQKFAEFAVNEEACLQQAADDYGNAVALEPTVPEYYEKIVVVFIVLNDENNIELWLKQGYQQTQDSSLYDKVIQRYIAAEDYEMAEYWLKIAYAETKDESLNEKYEKELTRDSANVTIEREDHSIYDGDGLALVELYYDKAVLEENCSEYVQINQQIQSACDEFISQGQELVDTYYYPAVEEGRGPTTQYPYFRKMDGEIVNNKDGLLSIKLLDSHYMGGVVNRSYYGMNFNLKTGEEVKLTEIFSLEEERLLEYLIQQTKEYIADNPDRGWWDDDTMSAAAIADGYNLTEYEFYIEDNNVFLCYATYELGPGAMGSVVVPCPII